MAEDLRPLTLGEILDRTLQLYRRNFRLIVAISIAPSVVVVAVWTAQTVFGRYTRTGHSSAGNIGFFFLIVLPLLITALTFAHACLTAAAVDAYLGRTITMRAIVRGFLPRCWKFLWLTILQTSIVFGLPIVAGIAAMIPIALIALLLGGLSAASPAKLGGLLAIVFLVAFSLLMAWLLARVALAVPVCWVEEKTVWASIKRSFTLSKGARGKAVMVYVFFYVLLGIAVVLRIGILAAVIGTLRHFGHRFAGTSFVVTETFEVLYSIATQVFLGPMGSTAFAILYIDQRVRKEGFDIDWMMYQAGLHAPREAAQTVPEDTSMPLAEPATVKEP